MKISFVIPAYNEEAYIGDCLASLKREIAANGKGFQTEIIVINNASTDKTADVAASFDGVRVVDEPIKGLTRARQRGLEEARGEIIAYFDADCVISARWIPNMLRTFANHPETVCVSGPCIFEDLPWGWKLVARPYVEIMSGVMHLVTGHYIFGGNFAAKKSALVAVGGFDASIIFYGEDLEVAFRLSKVGKIRFVHRLAIATSARRFNVEGIFKTTATYAASVFSMTFFKKPVAATYKDIR